MKSVAEFEKTYRQSPENKVFAPYRICPIGAHIDHNLGKITGFAINKGISIVYSEERTGSIELSSLQFAGKAYWHINNTPETKQHDWADHLRGTVISLKKRYNADIGLKGIISGDLPIGGLSSSAAVILSFLQALCNVNNIKLTPTELITIAKEAENKYVGVSCGKLDQSCEVYCKKNHLLYMDLKDDSYELIPQNKNMKPYKIGIFFSGLERSLAGSRYNMRSDEVRSAAYLLKALSGIEYGTYQETNLRDVPYETYLKFKDRLPENWMKRAEHFYSEYNRVEKSAEVWKNGDIETFGKLSFESGHSSIYNYETGSPELKTLYEIMLKTDGIYGGRFSGAGFKGCCMALIDPAYEESILNNIETEYLKAFPDLKGKYSACICETENGIFQ